MAKSGQYERCISGSVIWVKLLTLDTMNRAWIVILFSAVFSLLSSGPIQASPFEYDDARLPEHQGSPTEKSGITPRTLRHSTEHSGSLSVLVHVLEAFGDKSDGLRDQGTGGEQRKDFGNPLLFQARNFDTETGLYYFRARYYSPKLGRFLSPDPKGFSDSTNPYQYCLQNPVNLVDPDGEIIPLLIAGALIVGPALVAEATQSDAVAAWSPAHNIVRTIKGEEVFSGEKLSDLDRVLAGLDVVLSLVPGASKLVTKPLGWALKGTGAGVGVVAYGTYRIGRKGGAAAGRIGQGLARVGRGARGGLGRGGATKRVSSSLDDVVGAIGHNADVATELARRAAARGRISNSAQSFGVRAHKYFERLNNRLNRRLIGESSEFRVIAEEFRDALGNVAGRRARDSIGPDAIMRSITDSNLVRLFDLKTHGGIQRLISATRQNQFMQDLVQ